MENKNHFKTEKEVIEWLFEIVNYEEEFQSLLEDYSRITGLAQSDIERRLREKWKNENLTANQERF
jgi:hypothetical protein